MDLNSLIIIEKIVNMGTFSAAAQALGMPKSNLSLKVKQLESDLGQTLFLRSTRRVVLTDFGRSVLEVARPLYDVEKSLRSLAEEAVAQPQGTLKITAPFDIGLYLLKSILPNFLECYPKVAVDLDLNNHYLDIIGGGFDLAIRATTKPMQDSSMVSLKLGETYLRLYAAKDSPLARLDNLEALSQVPIMSLSPKLKLQSSSGDYLVLDAKSRLTVRDMAGIMQAVIGGAGVGVLPDFFGSDQNSFAGLCHIFADWTLGKATVYALYPRASALSPKNRSFISFLKESFQVQHL